MNSPDILSQEKGKPSWTARLWVRLTLINLLAIAAVVVMLTVFIAYRANVALIALPVSHFQHLQSELRLNMWQGMAELLSVVSKEILLTSLLGIVLALAFALLLSTVFSRYVGRLTEVIRRLAAGDFKARVQPSNGPYELNLLEHSLNLTATHLEYLEQERQFESAAIAHELRTPITALRLRVLGLQDGIYPLQAEELEPLNRQLEHLEQLAEALQTLTLADAGQLTLQLKPTEVEEVLQALRVTFGALADRGAISFAAFGKEPLWVQADVFQLHKALGNLIQNALKHTPAGGMVRVEATAKGQLVRFSVVDSGPGVPAEVLNRLFDRFYRADESRNRQSGGSGLGLAIVRAIAEAHGGNVRASRASTGGLHIDMYLPLYPLKESGLEENK